MEKLSSMFSYHFILGILLSDFFLSWINKDKRHKHVIVPDVISEMPIPIKLTDKSKNFDAPSFDLKFSSVIKRLENKKPEDAYDELVFLIESITLRILSDTDVDKLKIFLNKLVSLFYRPVLIPSTDFAQKTILSNLLGNSEAEIVQLAEEKTAKSGRRKTLKRRSVN